MHDIVWQEVAFRFLFIQRAFLSPFVNSSCLPVHSFWKGWPKPFWSFHYYLFTNNQAILILLCLSLFSVYVTCTWPRMIQLYVLHDNVGKGMNWVRVDVKHNYPILCVLAWVSPTGEIPDRKRRDKLKEVASQDTCESTSLRTGRYFPKDLLEHLPRVEHLSTKKYCAVIHNYGFKDSICYKFALFEPEQCCQSLFIKTQSSQ